MAKRVKHYFSQSPFTQNILIAIGQSTHRITTRMTIWSAGFKVKNIQPLEKEAALTGGAEFIGEFFIFAVAGSLVVFEYDKSKQKELKKDNALKEKMENNTRVASSLEQRLEKLEIELKQLEHSVHKKKKENKTSTGDEIRSNNTDKRRRGWLW